MLMIPKSLLCSFLHIIKEEKIKKGGVIMDEKLLYNVKEVSKCLGVNVHLVYALIRKGLLPALKLGSLKVRKASLESFVAKYEGMDLSDLDNITELKAID